MSMYKVAVIGDKDSILGFKSLGVTTYPVTEEEEVPRLLNRIAREKYAVVCVTENVARQVMPQLEELNRKMLPAVLLIPNNQGTLGLGMGQIRKNAEKAIGADILFGKEG
jgi:V/A-type H+/Na+-transporting ATPase subunit F